MKNKTVFNNFLWRFLERCGAQGVTFIVSIVIARILEPKVYGMVALVTVFTSILQVFIDSGLGSALVQKKDADDLDFSTVFYFNMTVCIILYIGMYFASPLIAKFYKMPDLTPVIRVLSLTLIISGVKNIQQSYVSKHMIFKKFFFATLGGTIGAAFVGVFMAIKGYGVWALVAQNLFNMTVDTIILWITVKWRPRLMFSFKRLKGLLDYGWKLLASSLLDRTYNELRQLIIGRMYAPAALAFYNKGRQFPNMVVQNIKTAIDSVLFPAMSAEQDDISRVREMTRRSIKTCTYIMMPIMMGLAVCAKPIVLILLTEKWLPCVPFLRIFCFTYSFYPVNSANVNAVRALGRSDVFLKLEIRKKVVGLAILFSVMWFGVMAIGYSLLFGSIIGQLINAGPNKKLLGYGYGSQLKDMMPQIILSLIMGACTYPITFLKINYYLMIAIEVVIGVAVYWGGSKLLKNDSYDYIVTFAKSYFKKDKKTA